MRIKLDENLPHRLQPLLAGEGHDVHTVADEGLAGTDDTTLLERLRDEGRVLLTLDKRLADVRRHPPDQFARIILVRIDPADAVTVSQFVQQHVAPLLGSDMKGRLVVVTRAGARFYGH